jgi:hypothetical protein
VLVEYFLTKPSEEFHYSNEIVNLLRKKINEDYKSQAWNISDSDLSGLENVQNHFEAFVYFLELYRNKVKPGANTFLFKAERLMYLFQNIPEIYINYYSIRIMAILRDCRAVYYSQKMTCYPSSTRKMSVNPIQTAVQWSKFVKSALNNSEVIIVAYEDLILHSESVLNFIKRELKIINGFVPEGTSDYYKRLPEIQKSIHENIQKPPQTDFVEKWKNQLKHSEVYLIDKYARSALKCLNLDFVPFKYPIRFFFTEIFFLLKYCFNRGITAIHNFLAFRLH